MVVVPKELGVPERMAEILKVVDGKYRLSCMLLR